MKFDPAIDIIVRHFPDIQAAYLFGSFGTEDERPDSDVDMALLLPMGRGESLAASDAVSELAENMGREVDLINLRAANTVFQKEIVAADRRICCTDQAAADEFEMRTISAYQKLNEERREIIEDALKEGRFVA